jgi:emfourin
MEAKRIKFERTGGFAGIRFAADIALADMPQEQAQQINDLLDELDFEKLPEQITGNPQMADGFTYSITLVTEKYEHTVTTSDTAAPQEMEPLLEILTQIAIQKARSKK